MDGVFLYQPERHSLANVSERDVRGLVGLEEFVAQATCILAFVLNHKQRSAFKNSGREESYGYLAVGAMSEHVYLAATSLGINTRYIASIRRA
jgi:nitroreductase